MWCKILHIACYIHHRCIRKHLDVDVDVNPLQVCQSAKFYKQIKMALDSGCKRSNTDRFSHLKYAVSEACVQD